MLETRLFKILNNLTKYLTSDDLEKIVGQDLFKEINQPEKFKFIIDQRYFFNLCYHITMILAKFGYFLRIYELKKKYRHLFMKKPDQQKIWEKYEKKERKNFEPIDIIYKPTKDLETEPVCYFSTDISLAYSAYNLRGSKMKRATKV